MKKRSVSDINSKNNNKHKLQIIKSNLNGRQKISRRSRGDDLRINEENSKTECQSGNSDWKNMIDTKKQHTHFKFKIRQYYFWYKLIYFFDKFTQKQI